MKDCESWWQERDKPNYADIAQIKRNKLCGSGPIIAKTTQQLLGTIKKYYPNATWDSRHLDQLSGYDTLIINNDPGWEYYNVACTKKYNINRMLYSSQKGIEKASRKYV